MEGFTEHMLEVQQQSRAYQDEEKTLKELLIVELEKILTLFDEPGNNIHDIKQFIHERIEKLRCY